MSGSTVLEQCPQSKIWKYMDLAKFISLHTHEALYFSCPSEFDDPYEGLYPKSQMHAFENIVQNAANQFLVTRHTLASMSPDANLQSLDDSIARLTASVPEAVDKSRLKFGVSCWHRSEYESEAMWKLYSASGQGIAIESTIGRLHQAIPGQTQLTIETVRYMDFERDPIEKGHKHYGLFLKRKSFEHEKELRATVLLKEDRKGEFIKCNLEILIAGIHVSPLAPSYFKEAVETLCAGDLRRIKKPVIQSALFTKPS